MQISHITPRAAMKVQIVNQVLYGANVIAWVDTHIKRALMDKRYAWLLNNFFKIHTQICAHITSAQA